MYEITTQEENKMGTEKMSRLIIATGIPLRNKEYVPDHDKAGDPSACFCFDSKVVWCNGCDLVSVCVG